MRSIFVAVAFLPLLLTSCFGPSPGHGAAARTGYHHSEHIIAALDRFHGEHGHYPAEEKELVPRYLPSLDVFALAYAGDPQHLFYHREGDGSFSLGFNYVSGFPSYMNHCSYSSKTRQWECHGYY